jgi:hypothetical protein
MVLLAHTCSISRKQTVGTNGRQALAPVYSDVPCLFLPMATRTSIEHNFALGRGFDTYFDDGQDVKIGDKLGYNGSTFVVRFIQPFSGLAGGLSHVRAMTEQEVS